MNTILLAIIYSKFGKEIILYLQSIWLLWLFQNNHKISASFSDLIRRRKKEASLWIEKEREREIGSLETEARVSRHRNHRILQFRA